MAEEHRIPDSAVPVIVDGLGIAEHYPLFAAHLAMQSQELLGDPAAEKLKAKFDGVSRIHVPMHALVRSDEAERHGVSKVTDASRASNVTPFPVYDRGSGRETR